MRRFLICAAAVFSLTSIAHAEERVFEGMICKTPEAIRSAFAIYDALPDATIDEIIAKQNSAAPDSCTYARVHEEDVNIVSSFKSDDRNVEIKKVLIKTICQVAFCVRYGGTVEMFIAHWRNESASI